MKIGLLGGGQLAQLLAHSACQLGMEIVCYSENTDCPAARNAKVVSGQLTDQVKLTEFAQLVDTISLENENIDTDTLNFLAQFKPVAPNARAIKISQDRLLEKNFFKQLGINTAIFSTVDSLTDLQLSCKNQPLPALLKTRRFGYDGKGQVRIDSTKAASKAWSAINEQPAILESFVDFDYEVSLIAARNSNDQISFFPLIKNQHHQGILRISSFIDNKDLQAQAEQLMRALLEELDYVGVLTIEFFVKDNQLYANELAPRVHNSGHLTIEACNCSQFEAHLRAIAGYDLPEITVNKPTAMINLIGSLPSKHLVKQANLHYYDYGKQPRPNRKLGHLTLQAETEQLLFEAINKVNQKE